MAVKLHKPGYDYARKIIEKGLEVERKICDWDEHKPTNNEVDIFIDNHYMDEYGLWFLGVDTDIAENLKERYLFPHGDLKIVHKAALVRAEEEAAAQGYQDIRNAALELITLISKTKV